MLSIGRFAEISQVSPRTVRHYEAIGLLPTPSRGENNYRYYDQSLLERMLRIRELQEIGFSLDEIKSILLFSNQELKERLILRLSGVDQEVRDLQISREKILKLLSVSNKVASGDPVTETERKLYMETVQQEVLHGLKKRYAHLTDFELSYLDRDPLYKDEQRMSAFMEAVRRCIEFAKQKKLILGPVRGSSPASLSLFGLGISSVNPMEHQMIPERLQTQAPSLHIDVEFERGKEFVEYCREINKTLSYGEIQAFRMPLIDIVKKVHEKIGRPIHYAAIDENSNLVLRPFRLGQIEKIFQFDFSERALVMKYENFLPEYLGLKKIRDFLARQDIRSFRDVINITALWRPNHREMVQRIECYAEAQFKDFSYGCLAPELQQSLNMNRGMILYHEDLMRIISHYTGWNLARCNSLRRAFFRDRREQREQYVDWQEFRRLVPTDVADLIVEESQWSFCLPHAISFGQFTKQTAILTSLHRSEYFAAIASFENKHGFAWDDIGIRIKGVSLLQD